MRTERERKQETWLRCSEVAAEKRKELEEREWRFNDNKLESSKQRKKGKNKKGRRNR